MFLLCFCDCLYAVEAGQVAPDFCITSGTGQELTPGSLKGRIIIMFYETRNVVEKNRALKDALENFCANLSESSKGMIISVPVINCSSSGLFKGMWKNALINNSKKEGLTIYGDWDGKMFAGYDMTDNESNFLVIDKEGIVRYVNKGVISAGEINTIEGLIGRMVDEK